MKQTQHANAGLSVLLLVVLALVVSACGGSPVGTAPGTAAPADPAARLQAAKAEGQVNWYTMIQQSQAEKLAKQFQAAYGIKVELTRAASPQIMQKYQLEWESKNVYADVVMGSDVDVFADMANKGMLKERDSANGKKIIESLRDAKGRWYTFYVLVYLMAYNKDLVSEKDAPKSWRELTDPKFKDQMIVVGEEASGGSFIMLAHWYKMFGAEYFKGFAANKPMSVSGHAQMQTIVESKQKAIMSENALHLILGGAAKGIVPVWPTEGPLLIPVPMAVAPNAPHPNAAELFADWLLSKEIQDQFTTDYPSASGNPEVPRKFGIPELSKATVADWEYVSKNRDEIWKAWSSALGKP